MSPLPVSEFWLGNYSRGPQCRGLARLPSRPFRYLDTNLENLTANQHLHRVFFLLVKYYLSIDVVVWMSLAVVVPPPSNHPGLAALVGCAVGPTTPEPATINQCYSVVTCGYPWLPLHARIRLACLGSTAPAWHTPPNQPPISLFTTDRRDRG